MRATSPLIAALVILISRCLFADQANTNAPSNGNIPPEALARAWISSFEPFVVSTDHQLEVPRPCTPEIPQSVGRYWETNYDSFSKLLVVAAAKATLDSESLAKMLRVIRDKEREGLAVLPVEADSTQFRGEPVWDIRLRWEYSRLGESHLVHICSYTFSRKTLQLLYRTSCG
jgi:hypothetical protein